jgi:4-alpha-glucanotransferase
LKAEQIVDSSRLEGCSWMIELSDYDLDGQEEILISGRNLNCYISPHVNASVFALEYKPKHYNLSNILMRHPEIYHKDVMNPQAMKKKTPGEPRSIHDIPHVSTEAFKALLVYDTYPKNSFMTHYLETPVLVEKILHENRIEPSPTAQIPFSLVSRVDDEGGVELTFIGAQGEVEIRKTFRYDASGSILLSHDISPLNENAWVVLEWNIITLTGARPCVDSQPMENDRGVYRAQSIEVMDDSNGVHVRLESDSYWVVCIVPIECVSQSEEGFEKTFQGWSIYFMLQCHDRVPDVVMKVSEPCQS